MRVNLKKLLEKTFLGNFLFKKKSLKKFGKNEFLFRKAANTGGSHRISAKNTEEISELIRKKDSNYYKALTCCVESIDPVFCTGIIWYKPEPSNDNDTMNGIVFNLFKAYFFYVCDMPVVKRYFEGEAGHTYIKEDGVHLFTFYNMDNFTVLRSDKAPPNSFISRIRTKKEALHILRKPGSFKDFILFSAEKSSSTYYDYKLDEDMVDVFVSNTKPQLKLITNK